jgi:SAM-dependent methyltransferase
MSSKIENELRHGAQIKQRAEAIWGWSSPAGRVRAEKRARLLIERAGINASHAVLEIGCGSGIFTEKVARTGASITATDLSEDLLELARSKGISNCRIEVADAHRLRFPEASFDIVYGSSILHHLDIGKAFAEIYRVLKPGGRAVFGEPNMLNPQILIMKNVPLVKRRMGESPDETAFFRWSLAKKLKDQGFVEVSVLPHDFLHPAVPGLLVPLVSAVSRLLERVPLLREIAGSLLIHARKP